MSDNCPLPVEWLAFVGGEAGSASGAHLAGCLPCRELVSLIKNEAVTDQGLKPSWVNGLDLDLARPWIESHPDEWELGQIWLSGASFASGRYAYRDLDRLPLLILGESPSSDGSQWLEVAPMWIDSQAASQTDMLLGDQDTTLGAPFRVLFSLQTVVSWEQLDCLVGKLTESGLALMDSALQGKLDESHFGLPLLGSGDLRLRANQTIREIASLLAGFHALHDEERHMSEHPAADPAMHPKILQLEIRQVVNRRGMALAASMAPAELQYRVSLKVGSRQFDARLEQEFTRDALYIVIEALQHIDAPVRFITESDGLDRPVVTVWRSVNVGDEVTLAEGLGRVPAEVRLRMELQ